jgi:hypothetical protein
VLCITTKTCRRRKLWVKMSRATHCVGTAGLLPGRAKCRLMHRNKAARMREPTQSTRWRVQARSPAPRQSEKRLDDGCGRPVRDASRRIGDEFTHPPAEDVLVAIRLLTSSSHSPTFATISAKRRH